MQPFNIYSHYFENNAHSSLKPDDNKYNIIVSTKHGKPVCLVSRVPYTSKSSTEAHTPNCRNPNNLITIQRLPLKASNARHMSMCLLNARSINNKALFIKDYVVDHQIDILGITETWTKSDGESNRVVSELSPRGYPSKMCMLFPNMYSRVICKLVINDILMSFFTL